MKMQTIYGGNNMKKIISAILGLTLILTAVGCSTTNTPGTSTGENKAEFDYGKDITVISREDGSGTRSAFIELVGIEVKGDDGTKKDHTTKEAIIAKQTDIMMANISENLYSVGYISLGSLNSTVKALNVDGVEPSAENVKSGAYKIARPFNIATKGEISPLAQDFIDFILSAEGQSVVAKSYIPVNDAAPAYQGSISEGKITVAGSSSVTPVMEKLKEAYLALNPGAQIEIQQSDSSAGIKGVIDGTCEIGMASRELKDSEKSEVDGTQIAVDGIAVIVNPKNPISNLTSEEIKEIYVGTTTSWKNFS